MNKLFKFLAFFRIIDTHDKLLSITTLGMYICLYRLATVQQASYTDVGALLISLGSYNYKKYLNCDKPTKGLNDVS